MNYLYQDVSIWQVERVVGPDAHPPIPEGERTGSAMLQTGPCGA